jgi:hypothetical protein
LLAHVGIDAQNVLRDSVKTVSFFRSSQILCELGGMRTRIG